MIRKLVGIGAVVGGGTLGQSAQGWMAYVAAGLLLGGVALIVWPRSKVPKKKARELITWKWLSVWFYESTSYAWEWERAQGKFAYLEIGLWRFGIEIGRL